jgi:hypothetical protein
VHRRAEGDGAEDVGEPAASRSGRARPDHVDGAAAGEERVAVGEGGAPADQRPGAVGVVAAEGEEIGVGPGRTMRCELRGVEEDRYAAVVRAFDGEGGRPPVARLMSRMRRALGRGVAPVKGFPQGALS